MLRPTHLDGIPRWPLVRILTVSGQSASPTDLLLAWSRGEPDACDRLMPLVYDELRRLADRYMRHEPAGHTLQATALVAWV